MLYMLFTGSLPFNYTSIEDVNVRKLDNLNLNDLKAQARPLIQKMLEPDPNKRVSAEEALSDSWLTGTKVSTADSVLLKQAMLNMISFRTDNKLK